MKLFIAACLLAVSLAQTELYSSVGGYIYADIDAAQTACEDNGMTLCSAGQLFNAVFNEGWGTLCYSGYISDTYDGYNVGWFNAEGNCGKLGWNSWAPATPGAHCCDAALASVEPNTCESFDRALCLAETDRIIVDDPDTVWCTSGVCDTSTCCQEFVPAPEYLLLPETGSKYIYGSAEEAHDACVTHHPDLGLCTITEVEDLSLTNSMCRSGWWIEEQDVDNEPAVYGRGWYLGEAFTDDCNGATGLRDWAPSDGTGAAHCCVKSYVQSGYRVIDGYGDGDYSEASAEAYCDAQGYSYSLCTKDELQKASFVRHPNQCMSGWVVGEIGWWQGPVDASGGCGDANSWRQWQSSTPGAHCCLEYVSAPALIPLTDYGILPDNGNYADSTFTTGALAEAGCIERGYDNLCSIGQQAYVEENPDIYGDIACKVGWVRDGNGGYDSGYYACSGAAGTWNNGGWKPDIPVAHCCFDVVPEMSFIDYPYYNGDWTQVATQEEAEAMCTGDYSLCTIDQITLIATEGVTYNDVYQHEPSICRIGWTAEGQKGWYQGEQTTCGPTGWRTFGDDSTTATWHCCLPFDAFFGTTATPMPLSFIQTPESGYPFTNADEAYAACLEINTEYSLCADYEVIQAVTVGVTGNDQFDSVPPQDLCYSAYMDPDRSIDYMHGWYVAEGGSCGNGKEGWRSWRQDNLYAGAYCCYVPNFDQPATESPSPTELVPTDPVTTTPAPTDPVSTDPQSTKDPSENLPSTVASPSGCVDTGFDVDGFEYLDWCSADGTVYLNGRDTCVPSGGDETEMFSALQTVWDEEWYLAADGCDGGRTYDEATEDQLWITNEMCNNLEEDIAELESSTGDYMSDWTAAVIALVEAQKENFGTETQQALDDYLASIQNPP